MTAVFRSQAQRRVVADLLPNLADRLKLAQKYPRTILIAGKELEAIGGNWNKVQDS